MGLSREEFLSGVPERVWEELEVPGWGLVNVATLDAMEYVQLIRWLDEVTDQDSRVRGTEIMARTAVRCLVDDQGNRLLQDDDLTAIYRRPGAFSALPAIFEAANRINRIVGVAVDDTKKA